MRRLLSILLAAVLGLGPVLTAVPAQALASGHAFASGLSGKVDESQIPACCRRNGKHHCAMAAAPAVPGQTTLSATSCCPCAPRALVSTAPAPAALAAAEPEKAAPRAAARVALAALAPPPAREDRNQPKRGPPALLPL